jgi:hypothetical protein
MWDWLRAMHLRCGALAVTLRRDGPEVVSTTKHQWAQSDTGHRVAIHGEDQLPAPEQAVSVRLGLCVRKQPPQRPVATSCFPKAFVDAHGDLK